MPKLKDRIARAKAPKPPRQTVHAPNPAVAKGIMFARGVTSAIRDTNARVMVLADEVEATQDAGRETERRVQQVEITAQAANAATARRLEEHAARIEANRPADLERSAAVLAQWQAERDAEIAAARADYDREYDRVMEAYHATYEDVSERAATRYSGREMQDAWQKMIRDALAPYDVQLDELTDKLFDRVEFAEAVFDAKRKAALPLPTSDAVTAEWETDRTAMNAAWDRRRTYYRTDAALDAAYAKFSAMWDAELERAQNRWECARAHENRMAFFDKDFAAAKNVSEEIMRLQLDFVDIAAMPPTPFDGRCPFGFSRDGYLTIAGLSPDKYLARFKAALEALHAECAVREFESG